MRNRPSNKTNDAREKIQALSLAKDCYGMKLDLLTNASVIDKALEFVEAKQLVQNNAPTSSNQTSANNTISDNYGPDTANDKHSHKKADENIHEKINVRKVSKTKTKLPYFCQGVSKDDIQGPAEETITRRTKTTNQLF